MVNPKIQPTSQLNSKRQNKQKQNSKLRSKKQIYDIIEYNQNTFQNSLNASGVQTDERRQKTYLHQLYNQDIAPQDSEKTLFYYLKTLAYEMIIVLLTFLTIFIAIIKYYDALPTLSDTQAKNSMMLLTGLTIITAAMQTQTRVKWLKEKKEKENSAIDQYLSLILEILLLLLCPNNFINGEVVLTDYTGIERVYTWDQILTVLLLGRLIYVYRFIIHSQLYYGSRPDRLSRLYTVKFGTFNAFKFLINEKPMLIVSLMFTLNLLFFPTLLLLIQGKINPDLGSFMACIHYAVVTQVTVGYGNVKAITIFGRAVSLACVLIGVTSTSLLLIFFMRLMQQSSQEEQAHLLLSSLQKRQEIAKARVLRIQMQYLHSKIHCTPEQKEKNEQKLRQFRFENRRNILFQREQPANVKRMMLSNFSAVIETFNELKQKQLILGKIIQFIIKTNNSPERRKNDSLLSNLSGLSQDELGGENALLNSTPNEKSRRNGARNNPNRQTQLTKASKSQLKKTIIKLKAQ